MDDSCTWEDNYWSQGNTYFADDSEKRFLPHYIDFNGPFYFTIDENFYLTNNTKDERLPTTNRSKLFFNMKLEAEKHKKHTSRPKF